MGLVGKVEKQQKDSYTHTHRHTLALLTVYLGVKRDAFVIESAPEEEVGESCEGVKSKGKSRDDEEGEAHRSLRRMRFDSVLHPSPPPPVAIARKMRVSTKTHSGPSRSNFGSVQCARHYFKCARGPTHLQISSGKRSRVDLEKCRR